MTMDRRTFLRGSGAVALTLGGAGLIDLLGPAGDALAASAAPFPIGGKDQLLLHPHRLDSSSGFQSFAWSPQSKLFLYAQPAGASGIPKSMHYGDLLVSTITTGGETSSSAMQLNGFGHGGTMGVEYSPLDGANYLWIDANAHVPRTGAADARAICRIRYTGEGSYNPQQIGTSRMPHSQRWVLQKGSTDNQVNYDPSTNRIALRYRLDGYSYYAIYDVAALRKSGAKTFRPVYGPVYAGLVENHSTSSSQSFALWGSWLYALHGTKSKDDATLHAYNLRTKTSAAPRKLEAARTGLGREPEGLAVYTGASTPRLAFGIKNDLRSSSAQTSAIYYKY